MAYDGASHFIGRHEEREQIKQMIISRDVQILQIYGLPSVGKTELVKQVCQELRSEIEVQTVYRQITNGLWPDPEICQVLKNLGNSKTFSIIVLDCFENLSKIEEFNKFCLEIFWSVQGLKIILVFQGLAPLKVEGFSDTRIQIKPMNKNDARSLFYRKSTLVLDKDSDAQVDELVDYCGALPGQIIELTNKISQFPDDITLTEVYEFVKDNKDFLHSEDIFGKLSRHVKSLSFDQCRGFSEMVYFPGTFNIKDITEMVNYKTDLHTKFVFLYPLLSSGLVKSTDEEKKQFEIPILFQDYGNQQLIHLRHEDTTKLKFSTIIGKTLMEAEQLWEMGLAYEALGIMKNNWPNMKKLFQQAIHLPSDGNSFQIYYKVAVNSCNIISSCYPNEAKLFCRSILNSALVFGSEDQQAFSMASYGHTLVDSFHNEALHLYETARGILSRFPHQDQLIVLLYNMSKAYYLSGNLKKGIRCAEEALTIQVTDRDNAEIQHIKVHAASYLAYNLIFATEYKQAEKILLQTLQEVGESGHPAVSIMLNSLGLKEERSKGDMNKALTWYLASLSKKQKLAKFKETLLVTTLCNVAGQLSKTKLKHDSALNFLYKAEAIRRKAGWVHAYSGLVVWNIGMVYMRKQMPFEAVEKIKEAEKLYAAVNQSHYVNAEVKVWLAHCHLLLGNAQEAKQIFLQVFKNGEQYRKYRPQGEFILNALEHLVHLSIRDPKEQQFYIEQILKELPRLKQSPGMSPVNATKYRQLLLKYMEQNLKIAENYAKSELRSGIFLESIPDTCLACQEVLNYAMCPKEIYMQKMTSLTPACEMFDQMDHTDKMSVSNRKQLQGENEMPSTTDSRQITNNPENYFSLLNSGISGVSIDSDILPLPVKEFSKSREHLESVDNHQDVVHQLPDFDALLSMEENDVDHENNQIQPVVLDKIVEYQNSSASEETSNKGETWRRVHDISGNLTQKSMKPFERNENIPQAWGSKRSTNRKFHRTLTKPSKDKLNHIVDRNANIFCDSESLSCAIHPNFMSQRTIRDLEIYQKYVLPHQHILNTDQNRFSQNNSPLHNLQIRQYLPITSQIPLHHSVQKSSEPLYKEHTDSQDYFSIQNKLKEKILKSSEKNTLTSTHSKSYASSIQKTFSTIPKRMNDLNGHSSQEIGRNHCCTNANFISGSGFSTTSGVSNNQFPQLLPSIISRREPVEHEEKTN